MRKFKLIKPYPSIGDIKEVSERQYKDHEGLVRSEYVGFLRQAEKVFPAYQIEDFPEFWEEVKNYVILGGPFQNPIRCVKRISDDTLWVLGEKVSLYNDQHTFIDKFVETTTNGLVARTSNGVIPLEDLKKLREVQLTTEDGVEIYGGDKIYFVKILGNNVSGVGDMIVGSTYKSRVKPDMKYFKQKENADEFWIRNRQAFSIEELTTLASSIDDIPDGDRYLQINTSHLYEEVKKKFNRP